MRNELSCLSTQALPVRRAFLIKLLLLGISFISSGLPSDPSSSSYLPKCRLQNIKQFPCISPGTTFHASAMHSITQPCQADSKVAGPSSHAAFPSPQGPATLLRAKLAPSVTMHMQQLHAAAAHAASATFLTPATYACHPFVPPPPQLPTSAYSKAPPRSNSSMSSATSQL